MTNTRWLAPKELAAELNVHISTVRRWILAAEPSIEVLRVGSIVRVRVRACACASTPTAPHEKNSAHY
jgi:hypothetical protein